MDRARAFRHFALDTEVVIDPDSPRGGGPAPLIARWPLDRVAPGGLLPPAWPIASRGSGQGEPGELVAASRVVERREGLVPEDDDLESDVEVAVGRGGVRLRITGRGTEPAPASVERKRGAASDGRRVGSPKTATQSSDRPMHPPERRRRRLRHVRSPPASLRPCGTCRR